MNNNGKVEFWYSWPIIILALCIFWPVGVFLIIKRVSCDRKAAMCAGKLIGGLGIASYCIAALGLIVCISEGFDSGDIGVILFFGIAGFALRKVSKKIKKEADSVKQYLSIIINGNVCQLDTIASATGKSYDVVHKDIEKMINKGYLKNAYINEGLRAVVLPGSNVTVQNNAPAASATATATVTPTATASGATRVVACPCCGANNTITGDTGECEYCGTPLK